MNKIDILDLIKRQQEELRLREEEMFNKYIDYMQRHYQLYGITSEIL